MAVDHALVRELQEQVGARLDLETRRLRDQGHARLSRDDERELASELIVQVIVEHRRTLLESGRIPLEPQQEDELRSALAARMFGAGRLEQLIRDDRVENVDINGADDVHITLSDGRSGPGDPVAENDAELIEQIQVLASYAGLNSRAFDSANPELDLQLPDGSRLSAVMGVTPRPAISIRRHRFMKVTLDDLLGTGTMSEDVAAFLAAAVRARLNIMIGGAVNAGKTTLLRALANEIPAHERIITIERAMEIGLDRDKTAHPNVVAMEERHPNSEGVGGVSLGRLVRRTLRMNPDRVILGEVLGPEIVTMLNAMTQGNDGSLSTIHARSARGVFNRLATYARQAEEALDREATTMLAADGLDVIVFLRRVGARRSVVEIEEVDHADGLQVVSNALFSDHGSGAVRTNVPITDHRRERLVDAGWDDRGWWS
ncbi:MAG: CpaF family protein [Nocardioidaceae bacterium]